MTTFVLTGVHSEEAAVAATRGTGTATCTVTIPYSWALANGSTDMVNLSYAIEAPAPASTSNPPLPNRISTHSLPSMHVPANGTTTTVTLTATI